jgi:FlaA1/EpsC-like NDP-sugar epimerase
MTAASESHRGVSTVFASTRFGNVLGSRGSVIPLFRRQIAEGGPVTLTDRAMTRFIMTLEQAASQVLESVWIANGGEVMVTKMPVLRIEDIALVMQERFQSEGKVDIVEIGPKPGEKMYEELMNVEEVRRTYEFGDFFVILSAFADSSSAAYLAVADSPQPDRPYNSAVEPPMSKMEVEEFLDSQGVLG